MGHPIKFIEAAAKFVIYKFQNSLDDMKAIRNNLSDASNDDPTKYPVPEGQMDVLDQGNKEIDSIFEKIHQHMEQAK